MKLEARKLIRIPVAAALLGAALGMTAPAVSLAGAKPAMAVVQISDLNLATKSGRNKLDRRTASAIAKVCPLRDSAVLPRTRAIAAHNACAQSVRNSVKQQVAERGNRAVAGA